MYIYKNYNPRTRRGRVGDCVIRALTVVTGKSWKEQFKDLAELSLKYENMPNSKTVYTKYLENLGYKKYSVKSMFGDEIMTVGDLAVRYPKKVVVCHTRGHLVTCKNCQVLDSWDSSDERVYSFFIKD